ncbi:hypothetical protein NP493_1154g00006 [Ridgeia piscesae]|uniref:Uncharacterized protein n=1 Tax=Ridgeia piscesae TaxID=27915 RepID=A0AAD9KG41_RIDPI|nr:hypothetical protein NP493_1154g00006 [Ridgeia piscesae]
MDAVREALEKLSQLLDRTHLKWTSDTGVLVQLTTAVDKVDIGTQTDLTLDSDLPVVSDDVTVVSEDQQNLLQNLMSRTAAALLAPVALTSMSPDGYDSLTSNAFMSLCDPSLSPDSLFVQSHRGAAGDTNNVTSDLGPCSDRGDILADQNGL